jgi:hypothetical protein
MTETGRNVFMALGKQRVNRLMTQLGAAAAVALTLLLIGAVADRVDAGSAQGGGPAGDQAGATKGGGTPAKKTPVKLGLAINAPKAFQGYTLISTMMTKKAYLIDMQGKVVHTWQSDSNTVHCGYLLNNGHLLRPTDLGGADRSFGGGPGALGRILELTWDGEPVWDF